MSDSPQSVMISADPETAKELLDAARTIERITGQRLERLVWFGIEMRRLDSDWSPDGDD